VKDKQDLHGSLLKVASLTAVDFPEDRLAQKKAYEIALRDKIAELESNLPKNGLKIVKDPDGIPEHLSREIPLLKRLPKVDMKAQRIERIKQFIIMLEDMMTDYQEQLHILEND
jgi:hypothetical protein